MNNTVSVIIPIFNREKYIEDCVTSVLEQSYENFEIILIDDGSTDKTASICQNLAKTESRVKFFQTEHIGVSAARNKALEKAKGDFVFFLDSDDIIHPFLFESLVSGLNSCDADIAATNVITVHAQRWDKLAERVSCKTAEKGEVCYRTFQEALSDIFGGKSPLNTIGGVMMRRELIGETRFNTEIHIGEDFLFIYENLIKGANALFLKQIWYFARWHGQNLSSNYDFSAFWSRFYRRELVWKSEENFGRKQNVNIQKNDAFAVFLRCIKRSKNSNEDSKKIRSVMKNYRKTLFPALSVGKKITYLLLVYMPFTQNIIEKIISKV